MSTLDKGLRHYGVKGMKWGIRNERLSMSTKSGDVISLSPTPSSRLASFLAKYSKRAAREQAKTANFDIKDPKGKTVGDLQLYRNSKDSMSITWITTKQETRGKGYGTAVMKSAINIAKDIGAKQVILEVPGNSPDAKHIYEKLGFKEVSSPNNDPGDVWGGLTNMRLDLNSMKHSDTDILEDKTIETFLKYLVEEMENEENMAHSVENTLEHFGIPGMKWGVRKAKDTSSDEKAKARQKKNDLKKQAKEIKAFSKTKDSKELIAKSMAEAISEKEAIAIYNSLTKDKGLKGNELMNRYQYAVADKINENLSKNKVTGNNGQYSLRVFTVNLGNEVYLNPQWVAKDIEHANLEDDGEYEIYFIAKPDGSMEFVDSMDHSVDEVLNHFGIPGMKWGVRKVQESSSRSAQRKASKAPSEDFIKSRKILKKKTKTLSNQELKDLNNRLNLEQNLHNLQTSQLKRGSDKVNALLATTATISTVYTFYKSPAGQAIVSSLKRLGG